MALLTKRPKHNQELLHVQKNPFLNLLILFSTNYRLKEVIYQDDNLYLIFEYCEYDLKKYMRKIGAGLTCVVFL